MRWALPDTFSREQSIPRPSSMATSSSKTLGSTTTPLPITGVMCAYSTPLGISCSAKVSPSTTSVWPALWPPW
jgi:hypothetical protein